MEGDSSLIHATEWIPIRSWAQIPLQKKLYLAKMSIRYGVDTHSLGSLLIHADRRGNRATPSEAGKRSLSRDGSLLAATAAGDGDSSLWRRLSPHEGATHPPPLPPLPSFPPLFPLAGATYRDAGATRSGSPATPYDHPSSLEYTRYHASGHMLAALPFLHESPVWIL
jgi:hypothetical protein